MKSTLNRRYDWIPDRPQLNDPSYKLLRQRKPTLALPSLVDLRPQDTPIVNQFAIGSCTANALAGNLAFVRKMRGQGHEQPSRLFIYWNERVMEGDSSQDAGAQIRDGVTSLVNLGAPPETDWPYDNAHLFAPPPQNCYQDALKWRVNGYYRINESWHMRHCLATGFPFVFGFTVYESFESAEVAATGRVPMPAPGEGVLGGHAVMAVGYDVARQVYIVRNSWGTGWGDKGYFYMPFQYVENFWLADDFWTLRHSLS